jgi:hypothetical protein
VTDFCTPRSAVQWRSRGLKRVGGAAGSARPLCKSLRADRALVRRTINPDCHGLWSPARHGKSSVQLGIERAMSCARTKGALLAVDLRVDEKPLGSQRGVKEGREEEESDGLSLCEGGL